MRNYLANWVLPSRCPICGHIVAEDHQFCLGCWQKLDFINQPWCESCGLPFAYEHGAGTICAKCIVSPPDHDGVRAAAIYDDTSSQIAIGLKYSTKLGLAELIARHLVKYLDEFDTNAVLVPVPLHRKRLWSRGFNQSVLIAQALSARSALLVDNVLVRDRHTPPLRSIDVKERQKLLKQAISVRQSAISRIAHRTILLVDDVYTTGATTNACARVLRQAGAEQVFVLCWARVVSDTDRLE